MRGEKPLPMHLIPPVVEILRMDWSAVAELQRALLEEIEEKKFLPQTGLKIGKRETTSPTQNYRHLGRDDYWLLEEWYYLPMLNLFAVAGFHPTPQEFATRLAIRVEQASNAVDRFASHQLIAIDENNRWRRTERFARFPTDRSLTEVRKYHQAILQKAFAELQKKTDSKAFAARAISSICFSGSSEKIAEARVILEEAVYRVANLMANEPVADEIYQLNLQLFPLTNTRPHEE